MSLRELHTAAVHIVHVERAADIDTDLLRLRFGIHPVDAESTLTQIIESTFSSYRTYGYVTMLWPTAHEVQELRCFVNRSLLLLIGDTSDHFFRNLFEHASHDEQSPRWQMNGPELMIEAFRALVDQEQPTASRANAIRLDNLTIALRQFGTWLQTDYREAVPHLILLAHKVDVMSDQVRASATPLPHEKKILIPRVVGSYAMAAAVMIVGVVVTLSLK